MKRYLSFLIGMYLFAGSLFLPLGDFGALPEYMSLFRYCQLQDSKLGLEDFYTTRVLGIDIADPFENDPYPSSSHTPLQFQYQATVIAFVIPICYFSLEVAQKKLTVDKPFFNDGYSYCYHLSLLRPPRIV
ncbi:MAG: hypothetical protein H7069_03500 [Phormidesmis sp. FL-bin-119]|nr:hypothetical protein [Pedobacter sp.]